MNSVLDMFNNKKIWIWGTGNTAALYSNGIKTMTENGFDYEGYVDNNSEMWGKLFNGKRVISPDELFRLENVFVLVCSIQPLVITAVCAQCTEHGVACRPIDWYILNTYHDEIDSVCDMLYDDASKCLYRHIVQTRISGINPEKKYVSENQYFSIPPFNTQNAGEVFVDCGGFTGDTFEQYMKTKSGVFGDVYIFEPDTDNFKVCQENVRRISAENGLNINSIHLMNCAVGDKTESGYCKKGNNGGLGSKILASMDDIDGALECKCVSLDDLEIPVSFLKADIESYEAKLLHGAEKTIKKYTPMIAICIYHSALDLFELPLLVNSLMPEYKLAVRHYSDMQLETVLYAWI